MKFCQIVARTSNDMIYSFNHYAESRTFGLCLEEIEFINSAEFTGNSFPLRRVGENYHLENEEIIRNIYERERWVGAPNYVAPYKYGIIFIDFKNKKLFSYNDYADFSVVFGPQIYMEQILSKRYYSKLEGLNESSFLDQIYMEKNFDIVNLNLLSQSPDIEDYTEEDIYNLKLDVFYQRNFLERLINLKNKYLWKDSEGKIWDLKEVDFFDWVEKNFNDVIENINGESVNVYSLPIAFHKFSLINTGWEFKSGNKNEINSLKDYMLKEKLLEKNDLLFW